VFDSERQRRAQYDVDEKTIMKLRKLLQKLQAGSRNLRFSDVVACACSVGFRLDRVNGSHHIFVHPCCDRLINLQDVHGKAKPYQVKQLLNLIECYNLSEGKRP